MIRTIRLAALVVTLFSLAGCAAIGAIAYKATPIGNIPAEYAPAKELAVVIVRNSSHPGENEIEADQLSRLIADQLRQHNVVPLVDDNTISDIRDRDPKGFLAKSIPDLGKAAGAKQVFYIDLIQASVDPAVGDQMVKGSLDCTVRVVDVTTGNNRWPADAATGVPLGVETPLKEVNDKFNDSTLQRKMQEGIAVRVGRLFYSRSEEDEDYPSQVQDQ